MERLYWVNFDVHPVGISGTDRVRGSHLVVSGLRGATETLTRLLPHT